MKLQPHFNTILLIGIWVILVDGLNLQNGTSPEMMQPPPSLQNQTLQGDENNYRRFWPFGPAAVTTPQDAFSNNFDACLFNAWVTASVLTATPSASCNLRHQVQLCYGLGIPRVTQFVSCYNKYTLIAEFTAHVVPAGAGARGRTNFRIDTGAHAPNKQAALDDYNPNRQIIQNPTWNQNKQYFCSKGHLTPNGDFNTPAERDLTMIITNIAPQWQKFNGGNWAVLETAVKSYARTTRKLYAVTGTHGSATHRTWRWHWPIYHERAYNMNGRVIAPKYYWKAVCDPNPATRQSIVFVAENNVGDMTTTLVAGCLAKNMASDRGVVNCYSLNAAQAAFPNIDFPAFHPANCGTNVMGNFLNAGLAFK